MAVVAHVGHAPFVSCHSHRPSIHTGFLAPSTCLAFMWSFLLPLALLIGWRCWGACSRWSSDWTLQLVYQCPSSLPLDGTTDVCPGQASPSPQDWAQLLHGSRLAPQRLLAAPPPCPSPHPAVAVPVAFRSCVCLQVLVWAAPLGCNSCRNSNIGAGGLFSSPVSGAK